MILASCYKGMIELGDTKVRVTGEAHLSNILLRQYDKKIGHLHQVCVEYAK